MGRKKVRLLAWKET